MATWKQVAAQEEAARRAAEQRVAKLEEKCRHLVSEIDYQIPDAEQAAKEYEETKRRVIEGRASVYEAQEFIDFIEGALQRSCRRRPSPLQAHAHAGWGLDAYRIVEDMRRQCDEERARLATAVEALDGAAYALMEASMAEPFRLGPRACGQAADSVRSVLAEIKGGEQS